MLQITYCDLDALEPDPRNARRHTAAQIRKIERLLLRFGWTTPMGQADGRLIFGHARRQAARNLRDQGAEIPGNADPNTGPVVDLSHLSAEERRAYALADNRIALDAGWNDDVLAEELAALDTAGFDTALTGFEAEEIAAMMAAPSRASMIAEVPVGPVEDRFWISVRGPLARQAEALQRLRSIMAELPGVAVELGTIQDGT